MAVAAMGAGSSLGCGGDSGATVVSLVVFGEAEEIAAYRTLASTFADVQR